MRAKPLLVIVGTLAAWASLTHDPVTGAGLPGETRSGPAGSGEAVAVLIASGLQGASGSAVAPDGALYVTEGAVGPISRVDPETGVITTFAEGLPPSVWASEARSTWRSSATRRMSWSRW